MKSMRVPIPTGVGFALLALALGCHPREPPAAQAPAVGLVAAASGNAVVSAAPASTASARPASSAAPSLPLVTSGVLRAPPPISGDPVGPETIRRSRSAFAAKLAKLGVGMPAAEATALLGPPDDVRTDRDQRGISATGTREVWRYGTHGHLSFATLGQVHIDQQGQIQYVMGGKGQPPSTTLFPEPELRRLLRLLDAVPSYNSGRRFDPLALVRAVNALQPLGKTKALAAITEYLRVQSSFEQPAGEGAFLVLRTLFELPASPGHMPPMLVGAPSPEAPADPTALPRFPILLHDGMPLLIPVGYSLAGQAEQPAAHVDHFRKHGKLRRKPLSPPDDPLLAVDRFLASPKAKAMAFGPAVGARLMSQTLRMLDRVYRVPQQPDDGFFAHRTSPEWPIHLAAVAALKPRWDAAKQMYVRADGSQLPARPRLFFQRIVQQLAVPGAERAQLFAVRVNPKRIVVGMTLRYTSGVTVPRLHARLLAVATGRELRRFDAMAGRAGNVLSGTTTTTEISTLAVPADEAVVLELTVDGQARLGPALVP